MQENQDPVKEVMKEPLLAFGIVYSATILFCVAVSMIPALSEETRWIRKQSICSRKSLIHTCLERYIA